MLSTHCFVHVTDNQNLQVHLGEELLGMSLQILPRNGYNAGQRGLWGQGFDGLHAISGSFSFNSQIFS